MQIHGMKFGYEAPFLRHFTAGLEPEPQKQQPPCGADFGWRSASALR
jgi:hypothetical protein